MNKELEYFEEADIVEPGRQHEFIGKLNELVDFVNKENEEKTCYCGNCDDMFGISHFTAGTCNKRFALNEEPQDWNPEVNCPCEPKCVSEVSHLHRQIDILGNVLLKDYQYEFGKMPSGESACEMAARLLTKSQPAPSETLIDEPVTKKERLLGKAIRNIVTGEAVYELDIK